MKVFRRIVAVLFVLVAAFLLYAVIHAIASPGGARVPVAIGYVVGAIVLGYLATASWRGRFRMGRSLA
jgi:multisubunit Na+/H+ antiporter MnhB subunit